MIMLRKLTLKKGSNLAFKVKQIYKVTSTKILPLVISTNGLVEEHLKENTWYLGSE